jgi:hypothetical protein
MNVQEIEICEFLKKFGGQYVSVMDISHSVGLRKWYNEDRIWATSFLRRMELDGVVETDSCGGYRLADASESLIMFKEALVKSRASLGDTTIISIEDVSDKNEAPQPAEIRLAGVEEQIPWQVIF